MLQGCVRAVREFLDDHHGNIGVDLARLCAIRDDDDWFGILDDICKKTGRVCELCLRLALLVSDKSGGL